MKAVSTTSGAGIVRTLAGVTIGDRIREREDVRGLERHDPLHLDLRQRDPIAGCQRDETVVHRRPEDRREGR
jgi:hypothetical protein